MLLRKPRSRSEVYNDLDGEAVNLFRVLREHSGALARSLALTPYAKEEYLACYAEADDPVERARRLIVRSFMGMGSKGRDHISGLDGRINTDGYISRVFTFASVPENVAAVAARLVGVLIENCDALSLLDRYDAPHTLFYLDPPYVGQAQHYQHKFSVADHSKMLARIADLRGMVILSGYDSPLTDNALNGWRRLETKARIDGALAGHEGKRTEVLWINPHAADRLSPENFAMVRA